MIEDASTADLLAVVRRSDATGDTVLSALTVLLARDVRVGTATAFDILAGEPRLKPSRGLLVDPTDSVRRRWSHRVAAGAAVVGSAAVVGVYDEIFDELSDSVDLAREVLGLAQPHADLPPDRRAALLALEP